MTSKRPFAQTNESVGIGPVAAAGGAFEGGVEALEELGAGDVAGAEGGEVAGVDLAVDEVEFPGAEAFDEGGEGDFRGVRRPREHGFAEERRA